MCPDQETKQAVVAYLLSDAEKNYETELLLFTHKIQSKTSLLAKRFSTSSKGLNKEEKIAKLKALIDKLAEPEHLRQIINDYERAGGTFSIKVRNEELGEIYSQRLCDAGHEWLVKHITIDPGQGKFTAEMENNIRFSWANQPYRGSQPSVYKELNDFYPHTNTKLPFLKANRYEHHIDYRLIFINEAFFHVARLGVLQNDNEKTFVYCIEPVQPKGYEWIKSNYSRIIEKFQRQDDEPTWDELQRFTKKKQFEISRSESLEFTFQFPAIASELKTMDRRTGPYRAFSGILAQFIDFKGERSLFYDQKGGKVRNYEGVCCTDGITELKSISIFYKISGPYFMIYEGIGNSDYYPFFITDPTNNLTHEFSDYPESFESDMPPTSSPKASSYNAKPSFFKPEPVEPVTIPFMVNQFVIEQGNDPYDLLDILPHPNEASITDKERINAYKQKAKQWHPDKCNEANAKEKMQLINTAYQILVEWKPAVDYALTLSRPKIENRFN